MSFSAHMAGWLADGLLVLHASIVLFVLGFLPLIWCGGRRSWPWVRHRGLRLTHLALMVFITLQTWLGRLCPLTVWEQSLRQQAGQTAYEGSFVGHWVSTLLYWDLPWWVFVVAYTGFAALVVLSWWWVPVHPNRHRP